MQSEHNGMNARCAFLLKKWGFGQATFRADVAPQQSVLWPEFLLLRPLYTVAVSIRYTE
jgi:hypothetical protein